MKRVSLFFTLLLLLVVASLTTSTATIACTGCTAADKQQCEQEADEYYQHCIDVWGPTAFCLNQASDQEDGCLMQHGCPLPVRNP